MVTSQKVTQKSATMDLPIELAMRYQNPSIGSAWRVSQQGVSQLLIPLSRIMP